MTDINHHLTPELLAAYSAGALPEAFSLVVATHISLCDACRAELEALDAIGGALLDRVDAAPMADTALEATLARISGASPITVPRPPAQSVFPAPLRAYVGGDAEAVRWRPVGGGVKQALLTKGEAVARLLYIPAGAAVPDHGHRGTELTLVLQGAFADEGGRFARGDVEVADGDVEHQPIAEAGADCICLAATDAPLRFTGILPRLAQRFIGI